MSNVGGGSILCVFQMDSVIKTKTYSFFLAGATERFESRSDYPAFLPLKHLMLVFFCDPLSVSCTVKTEKRFLFCLIPDSLLRGIHV